MKTILYFSFYFEPDLCAGSFRNSPLVKSLSKLTKETANIVVISTLPNRYSSYKVDAKAFERYDNVTVHRIKIPEHKSGFVDQMRSFASYYFAALKIARGIKADLVFASSSRLFTAFLGYRMARKKKCPLYLDIRDIFLETINDVVKQPVIRLLFTPPLKFIENRVFGNATHINLISPGFKPYFERFKKPEYSFWTNGIDDIFIHSFQTETAEPSLNDIPEILYAGNIGASQGLHILIPKLGKLLEGKYRITIIGDGGSKAELTDNLKKENVTNVALVAPVTREKLMEYYHQTEFFLIHLNDYDAFKRVLPSKVFELGASSKPILAGVGGYARQFLQEHVSNVICFDPGDAESLASQLADYDYRQEKRVAFVDKFRRQHINAELAQSINSYIN